MRAVFPYHGKTPKPEKRFSRLSAALIPSALLLVFAAFTAVTAIAVATPRAHISASRKVMVSLRPDRSQARSLVGQRLAATRRAYIFAPASNGVVRVSFFIDDPKMTGQPWTVARRAPYDLNGTGPHSLSRPFDLGSLADTQHTVTAAFTMRNGAVHVVSVGFAIRPAGSQHYTREVFDDEFSGTSVSPSNWNLYSGPGNAGRGVRAPATVRVDGHGHLVITASMVYGQIVSGGLQQRPGYLYGHYEFRVMTQLDRAHNMSGVVLLWPASQQVIQGEEDLYETLSGRRPVHSFMHDLAAGPTAQDFFAESGDATRWHTVAVDWTPQAITLYFDGIRAWTDTNPKVIPHTAHLFSMQLDPSGLQPLAGPVKMSVDYVRIFQ